MDPRTRGCKVCKSCHGDEDVKYCRVEMDIGFIDCPLCINCRKGLILFTRPVKIRVLDKKQIK